MIRNSCSIEASVGSICAAAGSPASRQKWTQPEGHLQELMSRYQRGDPNAVAELVKELSPRVLRVLAVAETTRPYAEDMLQEFWLRIHHARRRYRLGAPVLPWVFAIARRTRIDQYRHLCRSSLRELPLDARIVAVSQPDVGGSGVDFNRFIAKLPDGQRRVILMLKVAGMSLEEAARSMGSTVGAVKQKAHRAYQNLRWMARALRPAA